MSTSRASMLKNLRHKTFILPFSFVFCMLQMGLLVFLINYSAQNQLSFYYKSQSRWLSIMEKASVGFMMDYAETKDHIALYHYAKNNPLYLWDIAGDGFYHALTVYTPINLKVSQIEWVAVHYLLKEKTLDALVFPTFETRLNLTSQHKVKMVPHAYVKEAKAVYQYLYDINTKKLSAQKISIPCNEND